MAKEKAMEVKIIINIDPDNFDQDDLEWNITNGFEERTGYEVQQLTIEEE